MNQASVAQNITKVQERIRIAAQNCDRDPMDVTVLAVSKTRPADVIRSAAEAGLHDIGENYLQEALEKINQLRDLDLCWHFIGPIQSNKTRAIAENFDWVHSVDREKIARRLNEQRPENLAPLNICLQVNTSDEASKSGSALADLPALAATVTELPNLRLRGLMSIPAASESEIEQRAAFRSLRLALESLRRDLQGLDTLSMGMSADLEAAIMEGATIVRVGTDIFGPRGG